MYVFSPIKTQTSFFFTPFFPPSNFAARNSSWACRTRGRLPGYSSTKLCFSPWAVQEEVTLLLTPFSVQTPAFSPKAKRGAAKSDL